MAIQRITFTLFRLSGAWELIVSQGHTIDRIDDLLPWSCAQTADQAA